MIKVGGLILNRKTMISSKNVKAIKKICYFKQRRFTSLENFSHTISFSHIIAG